MFQFQERDSKQQAGEGWAGGGTLNVIFHGLFVFLTSPDGKDIQALIPNVQEHVYRAGNWLAETTIAPGEYRLDGVEGGERELDSSLNLALERVTRSAATPYATITVPKPKDVISLRQVRANGRDCFGDSPAISASSQYLSEMQVFRYTIRNESTLHIANHFWEPVRVNGVVNLHIFSQPDKPTDVTHMKAEYEAVAALFNGVTFTFKCAPQIPAVETEPLKELGIAVEETEDLVPRTLRLARLGRLRITGRDLASAWDGTEGFGSEHGACAPAKATT